MSRVMEIVSGDSAEMISRRAHKAFRRIGKVDEYKPDAYVEGRVNIDGYTAYMTVEWKQHRDNQRMKLDIAASSNDTLSRAADSAMYLFLDTFKKITPEDLESKDPAISRKAIAWAIFGLIVAVFVAAQIFHLPLFGR